MAKEDKTPAGGEGEGEPKELRRRALSGKKLVFFVIIPGLLVLLLLAGGAYFLLGKKKEEAPVATEAPKAKQLVYYNMPEILVNLNAAGRRSSFLKMSISLELDSAADVPRIQAVMPRIVDNMQAYLRELRADDLRGSAGLFRLREELLARVNAAAQPAKVNDVLFQEVLVQ
ncbi:MAG TPA: flagellar basal body-associated FliL family protein [Alphaproteobacteria bacterium]|nr:flagellar basal body-associated FliL family protein [Alphaproteobacteria bacterium]